MKIHFEKADVGHIDLIFSWLKEPHMVEFWDNSQEHKDDILNFIHGRPQHYFEGTTKYWVGYVDDEPYAFILSDILLPGQQDLSNVHLENMSKIGNTIVLDFGIGNKDYLGKGLASLTLTEFMDFYKNTVDPTVDMFFIDPLKNNSRASHVYSKAGFKKVGSYSATKGAFVDDESDLMVKRV